jgi:hypothetical protein
MNRVVIRSRVGRDGVLEVKVPLETADADREVQVTVEPIPATSMTQEEWRAAVMETAGKWQGELERPDQGELEIREPLP